MTYELFIGDPTYSSWSLRGWLLFQRFGISHRTTWVDFSTRDVAGQLAECAPSRTVPCVKTPEGGILWDSLAIAEELASRHPEAGLWPNDPIVRCTARSLAAEMHSGFTALRADCPMNLQTGYGDFAVSDGVTEDVYRIEQIWAFARENHSGDGPWLCGDYSVADVFYAPVAARIAGYGLQVSNEAWRYVEAHLNDQAFRQWRSFGSVRGKTLPWYDRHGVKIDWPGPVPLSARAVANGPSVNTACPFSAKPVTDFAEVDGQIVGFCNPGCRDKVVSDPEAWPEAMGLIRVNQS